MTLGHQEAQENDYLTQLIEAEDSKDEIKQLMKAVATLTQAEKSRIILHYCYGLTEREIAEKEGKSKNAIHLSLCAGMKKLKKFFNIPDQNDLPSGNK